jgi:hypothetical protein
LTVPNHQRREIREAVKAQLLGTAAPVTYATAAGARVYETRMTPFREIELPAIAIYALEETSADEGKAPRELKRKLTLEIVAAATATDDVDDVLDGLAQEIECAMNSDETFGSKASDSVLTDTQMAVETTGKKPIGMVALTYDVTYYTDVDSCCTPLEMDDLETVVSLVSLSGEQATADQASSTTRVHAPFAHWTFDEASGATAADEDGNYNLALTGTVAVVPGQVSNGRLFARTGTSLGTATIDDAFRHALIGEYTLAFWMKRDTAWTDANSIFYARGSSGSAAENAILSSVYGDATGIHIYHEKYQRNGTTFTPSPALVVPVDSAWHHVAIVKTLAGQDLTFTAYLDGVAVGSVFRAVFNCNGGSDAPTLLVGSNMDAGLDDLRLYASALTAAEVKALYDEGV